VTSAAAGDRSRRVGRRGNAWSRRGQSDGEDEEGFGRALAENPATINQLPGNPVPRTRKHRWKDELHSNQFARFFSPMNIALDIDGTITKTPQLFSVLSRSVRLDGGRVYIVTSRSKVDLVEVETRKELKGYGVEFDELCIIPDQKEQYIPCPHDDLDWYQKYLWQKVRVCLDRGIEIIFEDDLKVIGLFETYAPEIQVFQVR
jgi:hypothetical protein